MYSLAGLIRTNVLTNLYEHVLYLGEGVKVPITSSVYGYTKVLAHYLNSKKTPGVAIG